MRRPKWFTPSRSMSYTTPFDERYTFTWHLHSVLHNDTTYLNFLSSNFLSCETDPCNKPQQVSIGYLAFTTTFFKFGHAENGFGQVKSNVVSVCWSCWRGGRREETGREREREARKTEDEGGRRVRRKDGRGMLFVGQAQVSHRFVFYLGSGMGGGSVSVCLCLSLSVSACLCVSEAIFTQDEMIEAALQSVIP